MPEIECVSGNPAVSFLFPGAPSNLNKPKS